MKQAISYTIIFLGIQLLIGGLVTGALKLSGHEQLLTSPYTNIASMILFSLITITMFLACRWAVASKDFLLSRPFGVLFWSVMAALGVVAPSIFVQELMPELPNLVEAEMGEIMSVRGGYFVICLLAPLTEELVMRGAVLRALLAWKPGQQWAMIALSALFFAIIHMNPAQMPHAFAMGLLLGWMYVRTGSIVPGVAFHWANNTVAYLLYRAYPSPDVKLVDILGDQTHVIMAVGFSLCILLPAIYQLAIRMKREES